jgi:hypothetical protein
MNYYRHSGSNADLVDELRSILDAMGAKTFVVGIEHTPYWTTGVAWTEISKVELLIELHRGTPVVRYNFAEGTWELLDL